MATYPNSTTCPACGKWTIQGASYCHHCAHFLKAQFKSEVSSGPVAVEPVSRGGGLWNSDAVRWLIGIFSPPTLGAYLAWLNDYQPGLGAIIVTVILAVGGSLLLLLRWHLERPRAQEIPKPQAISVTMHEPLASGWRTYLDQFQDASITMDDLQAVARSVLAGHNFSREAMVKAGLSQPKARKVQGEFLRLNYACPLPNGKPGYVLTLRGRKLLTSLEQTPVTANNN